MSERLGVMLFRAAFVVGALATVGLFVVLGLFREVLS